MKTSTKFWLAIATLITATVAVPIPAHAGFIAYICDDALCTGGGDTIVTDNGPGDNFPGSAVLGQINAGAFSVGGFSSVANVPQDRFGLGSPLDLAFTATTTDNQSHTIWLYASATGYTAANGTYTITLIGTQPPAGLGNSVVGNAFGGNTNTNLDFANVLASVNSGASPYSSSSSGAFAASTTPYALTIGVVITRASAGTTTGDLNFRITPTVLGVPEPHSVALLAAGLAALAYARRRRSSRG